MSNQEENVTALKPALALEYSQTVNLKHGEFATTHLSDSNCQSKLVDSPISIWRASRGTPAPTSLGSSWWRGLSIALALWISCGLVKGFPVAAAAQDVPTGTIELSGGSVAAGVGYTWGSGTLIFQGKRYHLKVNGISILHVGISDYTASGTVYNLEKLSDISGIYTAISAGAALAGGASVTAMKNSHGVLIQFVATHQGINLSLGPKGVRITLAKA
jgi:hypothetical protein